MREFFRGKRFKVLVCVFALLLGFMINAALEAGVASLPERILKTITAPFTRLSSGISGWMEGNIDKVVNADKYKRENDELRKQISELNRRNIDVEELEKQIEQFRQMLEITKNYPDFKWAINTCSITARNANDVFGGFTINCGTDDGVSLYDTVITEIGLVGIITETAPNYSKVGTLISKEINIGVRTTRKNILGIIDNDIIYAKDGLCLISYITKDSDIAVGDTVVTNGSDKYPANYMVGEVIEVFDDANGLSMHALVKPSEDVFRLTDVLVVTDFEGKAKPDTEVVPDE